jgi:hypothetical protein
MAKLADLAISPATAEDIGEAQPSKEMHPAGMAVHPDLKSMEKMGMDMPKVGDKVHMEAHGHVVATHTSGMHVQLTHVAMKPLVEEKGPAEKLYGKAQKKEEKAEGEY